MRISRVMKTLQEKEFCFYGSKANAGGIGSRNTVVQSQISDP